MTDEKIKFYRARFKMNLEILRNRFLLLNKSILIKVAIMIRDLLLNVYELITSVHLENM